MMRTSLLLALILYVTGSNAQQMQLEVIPLKNRTAEQIIEVIKSLIPSGATMSGMNNQLIIKSTPANLAEIKQLLNSIDQPLRRLLITVIQDQDIQSINQSQSISGEVNVGNATIRNRSTTSNQRITITGSDRDNNNINFQLNNNKTTSLSNNQYTVQALDSQPAFIQSGLSVPVRNQNAYLGRNGVIIQNKVEYVAATSGFYVLPRVNGDRVNIMVAPNLTDVEGRGTPTFVVQNAQTTVSGRLGDWIEIGGLSTASRRDNRGLLSSNQSKQKDSRTILIKVEEIR
jgi:type II secretory pathway component GspD/PulD (secretin)